MLGKLTVVLLMLLLVWGNVVAGIGAGLACPDWPLCYGSVLPPLRWDIVMETGHRLLAAVTGVALIALCIHRALRWRGWSRLVPALLLGLLVLQIFLGAVVVLLEIPVREVTLHFAVAVSMFVLTLYVAHFDGRRFVPIFSLSSLSGPLFVLGLLVVAQSVLGAYVRHSGAAMACGAQFPTCLGYVVPPTLEGGVLNHFLHRLGAYLLLLYTLALSMASVFHAALRPFRAPLFSALALVLVQVGVGAGVVFSRADVGAVALHLVVALVFMAVVFDAWFRSMEVEAGVV